MEGFMAYLSANWLGLLVSLIIGYVLAWLFVGMPAGRKRAEAEQKASDLQTKLTAANRSVDDAKKETEVMRQQMAADTQTITAARGMNEEQKGREEEQGQQLAVAQGEIERL